MRDASWLVLAVVAASIAVFGAVDLIVDTAPASRAASVADVGMGLFGAVIAATGFRKGEPWAWLTLWYLPLFWAAHLAWSLPPGNDHVHQVVFLGASAGTLLWSAPRILRGRDDVGAS